jgi:hypothetical protein
MTDPRETLTRAAAHEIDWSGAVWALLLSQFNSPQGVAEALWDGGDNILINGTPLLPGYNAEADATCRQIRLYEPSLSAHSLPVPRLKEAELPEIEIQASTIIKPDMDDLQDRLVAQAEYLLGQEQIADEQVMDGDAQMREEEPEPALQWELIGDDLPGTRTAKVDERGVARLLNLPKDRFFIQPIHRGQAGAVVCEDGWTAVTLTPVMAVPRKDSRAVIQAEPVRKEEPDSSRDARRKSALKFILAGLGGVAKAAAHIAETAAAAAAVVDPILIQVDIADGAPISPFMAQTIEGFNRAQRAIVRLGVGKMSDALVAALTQKRLTEGKIGRADQQVFDRLPVRLQQSVAVRLEEVRLLQELLRSTFNHLVLAQALEAQRGEQIIMSPQVMAAIGFGARHAFLGLETQRNRVNGLSDISWDEVDRFIHSSGYFALQ